MPGHDIIVIGASAGGLDPVLKLVAKMPPEMPASVFVCIHVAPHSPSALPAILSRRTTMRVADVKDGDTIEPGVIYIAPPDHHLLVDAGKIVLSRGPKENRNRPSIDAMFRSAAAHYKGRVVGVVLSGTLDDGTAGLSVIKEMGGIAIVQNPADAGFAGMPHSAIENVNVDYILPVDEIAICLLELASDLPGNKSTLSREQVEELKEAESDMALKESTHRTGAPSIYSCPECSGVPWEVRDGEITRYRCRTGHAFSEGSLLSCQTEAVENALWVALRSLEERRDFANSIAEGARSRGHRRTADRFLRVAEQSTSHAETIRKVLSSDVYVDAETNSVGG